MIKKSMFTMLLMLIFMVAGIHAQTSTISGKVRTVDGELLPGVLVMIKNTPHKTITDENGLYSFTLERGGNYMILAILDGFSLEMASVAFPAGTSLIQDFVLKPKILEHTITVTQEVPPLISPEGNIGVISFKPEEISVLPSLGEEDIFRSMQWMPGISGSRESSSGLFIRGGTPDQNLVLLDGFTVYNVDHFFGIFSAFNPQAISDVTVQKGGYESKFGGRLSSITDMTGKIDDNARFNFGGGANFLSFNGFLDFPIGPNAQFFLAGRKSFRTPLYNTILDTYNSSEARVANPVSSNSNRQAGRFAGMFESEPISYFFDVNGKFVWKPGKNDTISLSLYNGADTLDNSREMEMPSFMAERAAERGFTIDVSGSNTDLTDWGNLGTSFNWMRKWGSNFLTHFTVSHSRYFNERDQNSSMTITRSGINIDNQNENSDMPPPPDTDRVSFEENHIDEISININNTINLGSHSQIEFGAHLSQLTIDYAFGSSNFQRNETSDQEEDPVDIFEKENSGNILSFFLQDRIKIGKLFQVTPGIRLAYYEPTEDYYWEPRFSMICILSNKIKLKASWGKFHQFANNLIREDIMRGDTQFWLLSDNTLVPAGEATHTIAGVSYEDKNFLINIEAYYKDLAGLSEFSSRFNPRFQQINYEENFLSGTGTAKGIEFLFQKKFGFLTGWASYTLGDVDYLFPELSDESFPAAHDVTHELKLVGCWAKGPWSLSATWIYATGRPYTEPISAYQETIYIEERDREIVMDRIEYGDKNGARLPAYHRLDLSANYEFTFGKTRLTAGLSLFNAYGHKNVWRKEYDIIEDELVETDINYLGFTPSLFLKIIF